MTDTAPEAGPRRHPFSYWVTEQRLADWTLRAVLTRGALALAAAAALTVATIHGHTPSVWAWPLAAVPFIGVYLTGRVARYVQTGRRPREPFARRAARVAAETQGSMSINVSGIADTVGVLALAVLGPWVGQALPTSYRLVAVAAAAGWLASYTSAIMVDVAWYNPNVTSVAALEALRRCAGPAAAVLLAVVTLPASWPGNSRGVALLICLGVTTVQLRVNETDRTLRIGADYSDARDVEGRRIVTTAMHNLVGNPLIHLKRRAAAAGPDFFDAVRQVEGGYRETLALDRGADVTADWPGVLASRLDAIAAQYGIFVTFEPPEDPMSMPDREVARFVLDDLTENAAKAGARTVAVTLVRTPDGYRAMVTDDGPGFRAGGWQRPGGGLERLGHLLDSRNGTLRHARQDDHTTITAAWRTPRPDNTGAL